MKMKNLAKSIVYDTDEKFINKIDKEINKLLQLRYIQNIILLVSQVEQEVKPISEYNINYGKKLKYKIFTNSYPVNISLQYSIDGIENESSLFNANIDFFRFGSKTIQNEKSNYEVIINHSFAENLLLDIIGETLFKEYYESIQYYEGKKYYQEQI